MRTDRGNCECEICGREFDSAAERDRHVREMGLVV